MRSRKIFLGLSLPLLAWSLAGCKGEEAAEMAVAPATIVISGGCTTAGSVSPDPDTLRRRQDIEWVLDSASAATAFTIEQKATSWPWKSGRKFNGKRGALESADGPWGSMNADPRGTHTYRVLLTCAPGAQYPTIDPTIIIPHKN